MPRPREFDPETALEQAVAVFWEKGYEATSVQDLVDRMGVNRCSIYNTFGDKHELFLKALQHYGNKMRAEGPPAQLARSDEGLQAIRDYFAAAIDHFVSPDGVHGCFVINTAVVPPVRVGGDRHPAGV